MAEKSDPELMHYLDNSIQFQDEDVRAARLELERRGLIAPENKNGKTDKLVTVSQVTKSDQPDMDETMDIISSETVETDISYPPKPVEENKKQSIDKSIISVVIFIAAFYFIFQWDLSSILILVMVIFIHEMGHYLAMKAYKYKDLGIFFVPLIGAFASGNKDTVSQKQRLIILFAGPIPGIIIGIGLYIAGMVRGNNVMFRFANIFLFINLFNLIPVIPLDGGRIVKSMFFETKEIISTIFLLFSAVAMVLISVYTKTYYLLIIPLLLLMQLRRQSQLKKIRLAIVQIGIDISKSYHDLTDREYWLSRDKLVENMEVFRRFITPGNYVISKDEDKIIKLIKEVFQNQPVKDLKWFGKFIFSLIMILNFALIVFWLLLYLLSAGIIHLP